MFLDIIIKRLSDSLDGRKQSLISFSTAGSGLDTAIDAEEVRVIAQGLATAAAESLAKVEEDLLLDFRPLLEKFSSRIRGNCALDSQDGEKKNLYLNLHQRQRQFMSRPSKRNQTYLDRVLSRLLKDLFVKEIVFVVEFGQIVLIEKIL